ncbi:imidazolonepropionase-like amidohydrolase [Sphingopyxis panaciterrae]|uniref:metal-dependent hydrolase family protein n=1 Tax=Sphingopyxis panaciterrae TaxID=363841 RepID=UPI0014228AAE|nr:amidohydrolase family protein [Sphingopyxis panaciterrae]NIJ35908.1 imidazolonepropionase-like amidohydrolase [Sphingopyxis panaciterrae]
MKKIMLAAMASAMLALPAAAEQAATYIHAGRLLADPASGRVETNKTIVVEGGKVSAIRDGFVGEGAVVDLRDAFVMPGFIDSHVHLTFESGPTSRLDAVTKSATDQAFDGVVFAKRTVRAGFTTVVDLGSETEAINGLRDAIATGKVVGPRIIAAGGVAAHGGHGDIHGYRQEILDLFRAKTLCSGADDCARAVRLAVQQGADIIKTASTGGVMSNTAAGLGQQMSDAELVAIVETAHRLGRKVAAHAHGTDGVNAALRAGVDSVEHGTYIDPESIRLFKAKGSYLVPTLLAGHTVSEQAETADWMPDAVRAKARTVGPLMVDALRRAHEGGVKIAFGTDSAVSKHGENAREFALMVEAGLTPLDTIRAATVWAATHVGLENEIGTLGTGKAADIVAVRADPLTDVRALETMAFVMKGGAVVRAADE